MSFEELKLSSVELVWIEYHISSKNITIHHTAESGTNLRVVLLLKDIFGYGMHLSMNREAETNYTYSPKHACLKAKI
jgi:hypothetical protein